MSDRVYRATPTAVGDNQVTEPLCDMYGRTLQVAGASSFTLAASAARTAVSNATGTVVTGLEVYRRIIVVCDITASATEAGDTLDVYVDVSIDNSKWMNAIHFTQQAGNGAAKTEYAILDPSAPGTSVIVVTSDAASGVTRPSAWGSYLRARWTVTEANANANASHTFSVTAYGQA